MPLLTYHIPRANAMLSKSPTPCVTPSPSTAGGISRSGHNLSLAGAHSRQASWEVSLHISGLSLPAWKAGMGLDSWIWQRLWIQKEQTAFAPSVQSSDSS